MYMMAVADIIILLSNEFENRDMLQSDLHVGWKWVNRLAPHAFVNYWWENDDFI